MKLITRVRRVARFGRAALKALLDTSHPILAHVIPMRRCNLACGYCNEYDAVSKPVPLEQMLRRVDRLSELRTSVVTVSGGEPLMHPELDAIVARVRRRGMIATLITNGYYLSPERIERLNRAGLDHLQISVDNVEPDETSMKSLRLLEPKLRWLAQHADFSVAINSVLGSGIRDPEDALTVARRARSLGFMTSVGILHDGQGQLRPLGAREMEIYNEINRAGWGGLTRFNTYFQENLARGVPNDWSCRAGARYLYVDEQGVVHYCSQQRGSPAVPLERWNRADIRREYHTPKACAPFCTVNCVQQVALFDRWRAQKGRVMALVPKLGVPGSPEDGNGKGKGRDPAPSGDRILAR
jgi:MoaA/NifB/PqqE/SkfB family radical SAM enzyme